MLFYLPLLAALVVAEEGFKPSLEFPFLLQHRRGNFESGTKGRIPGLLLTRESVSGELNSDPFLMRYLSPTAQDSTIGDQLESFYKTRRKNYQQKLTDPIKTGKSAKLGKVSPVVKFVLGDDEDLLSEYLSSSSKFRNTFQTTTIINIEDNDGKFSDRIIPTQPSKIFITEFSTPSSTDRETELTNKFDGSQENFLGIEDDYEEGEERVNSGLLVVRGPLLPKDDPDIVHLSDVAVNEILVTSIKPTKEITAVTTVTQTSTVLDIKTESVTKTSFFFVKETKTQPPDLEDSTTIMMMNWPSQHQLLSSNRLPAEISTTLEETSPLPPSSADVSKTTQLNIELTVNPTSLSTTDDLLEPTSIEFFLPLSQRDANATFNHTFNVITSTTETPSTLNVSIPPPSQGSSNLTTLIQKIQSIKNVSLASSNSTADDVTKTLQNILNSLLSSTPAPFTGLESKSDGESHKNIKDSNSSQFEIVPTDADPYRCRDPSKLYPLEMSYEELQSKIGSILLIDVRTPPEIEKTGRLPWSYNLPLDELHDAFKLRLKDFQLKYRFPKPGVGNQNVGLTYKPGKEIIKAWNILQKFGYCNVRLYFGSYKEWMEKGGTLVPFFSNTFDEQEEHQNEEANTETAEKENTQNATDDNMENKVQAPFEVLTEVKNDSTRLSRDGITNSDRGWITNAHQQTSVKGKNIRMKERKDGFLLRKEDEIQSEDGKEESGKEKVQ